MKLEYISNRKDRSTFYTGNNTLRKFTVPVAIDKRGHALKPVRGYSFTGEDTNTRVPWLLKK